MTAIKIAGRVLTASTNDRTITGLLLPYGEQGSTSIGRVTASAGSVTVPDDVATVVLNVEHDGTRPVGRASAINDTDDGLVATFTVAKTRAGDDVLEEAAEGLRAALSVEVDSPVVRAGALVGGALTGAGVVVQPAFPSAQLVASDYGEESHVERETTYTHDDGTQTTVTETTDTTYTSETTTPDDAPDEEEEDPTMGDSTVATAAAGGLAASRTATKTKAKAMGKRELFAALAAQGRTDPRNLRAALADIVPGDILGIEQPQYVGELWDGKAYQRQIIPLFNHGELTSFEIKGWRWVTKPAVAPYDGNKTEVPSNEVETEPVTITAERIAGAHDIDRKFRDFGDEAFFAAYYAAMTESYARVSDAQVAADIAAAATPVTRGTVPTDVNPGMVSVVDGTLAILNETDTMPTFALVATDLWRDMVLTREQDKLAYLNLALGLEEGTLSPQTFTLKPWSGLTAGQTLVGVRSAATVHELGGESPIRVEALDIAKGGVDEGVFGYYGVNIHDAGGLALVTAPAGD